MDENEVSGVEADLPVSNDGPSVKSSGPIELSTRKFVVKDGRIDADFGKLTVVETSTNKQYTLIYELQNTTCKRIKVKFSVGRRNFPIWAIL